MPWQRHGKTQTTEYQAWLRIKSVCTNPNDSSYHLYGGIGIKISEEWYYNFSQFLKDVGIKPNNSILDRKNQQDDFIPSNVFWRTKSSLNDNKKTGFQYKLKLQSNIFKTTRQSNISKLHDNQIFSKLHDTLIYHQNMECGKE